MAVKHRESIKLAIATLLNERGHTGDLSEAWAVVDKDLRAAMEAAA